MLASAAHRLKLVRTEGEDICDTLNTVPNKLGQCLEVQATVTFYGLWRQPFKSVT